MRLYPVSKLLEYAADGTLAEPSWNPRYGSTPFRGKPARPPRGTRQIGVRRPWRSEGGAGGKAGPPAGPPCSARKLIVHVAEVGAGGFGLPQAGFAGLAEPLAEFLAQGADQFQPE